jgi:hypothetical protein
LRAIAQKIEREKRVNKEMIDLNDAPVELDRPTIPEESTLLKASSFPATRRASSHAATVGISTVKLHWV